VVVGDQYLVGDVWVIVARGDLDFSRLAPLQSALEEAARTHQAIVLDVSGVVFGDSTFLNVLLRAHETATLRIAAPTPQVQRLLEITGADGVLHVHPTLKDATR
jgi:anti-anti-sigma factor